jgi:hypothetical protein
MLSMRDIGQRAAVRCIPIGGSIGYHYRHNH